MNVMYRRLGYMLTPQLTIYQNLSKYTKGKSVLEIGFGTGFGVLQYAHEADRVLGIEIEKDLVDFANWVMPLKNVDWIEGDICASVVGMYDVAYDSCSC